MDDLLQSLTEAAETVASNHSINIFDASKPESAMNLLRNESALKEFSENIISGENLTEAEKTEFVAFAQNSAKMFLIEETISQHIQAFAGLPLTL